MAEPSTHSRSENEASRLVMILLVLAMLLPLMFAFLVPVGGFFWISVIVLALLWAFLFRTIRTAAVPRAPEMRMVPAEEQPAVVRELMNVQLATEQGGVQIFRGPLLQPADYHSAARVLLARRGGILPVLVSFEREDVYMTGAIDSPSSHSFTG